MDTFLVNWYLITRVEQLIILFSKLEADSQQKKMYPVCKAVYYISNK